MKTADTIQNQKWIRYCREHEVIAMEETPGELGVIVELGWWHPLNKEHGVEYISCKTFAQVRAALGY
jgi:hypothetical protein